MANLNKKNKQQCQLVFLMLVVSLLITEQEKSLGKTEGNNPAVSNCTAMIDEIFAAHAKDEPTIHAMHKRINAHRVRFTKRVKDIPINAGLIGALELLTSDFIKSKPGTRFDFIVGTFRTNLSNIKRTVDYDEEHAAEFKKLFKKAVITIG